MAAPDIYLTRKLGAKVFRKQIKTFEGFSLVDFMVFPHWGSKSFKQPYLTSQMRVAYGSGSRIILLEDTQYVQVAGDMLRIVDTKANK